MFLLRSLFWLFRMFFFAVWQKTCEKLRQEEGVTSLFGNVTVKCFFLFFGVTSNNEMLQEKENNIKNNKVAEC